MKQKSRKFKMTIKSCKIKKKIKELQRKRIGNLLISQRSSITRRKKKNRKTRMRRKKKINLKMRKKMKKRMEKDNKIMKNNQLFNQNLMNSLANEIRKLLLQLL